MKPAFLHYKKLRPWLWRWHRRLGLAAALILILVTLTGIMLNHTSELELAKKSVQQNTLLAYYGIEAPTLHSFNVGEHWLSGYAYGQLYLDDALIGQYQGELVAAAFYQDQYWLACEQQLLVYSHQAELLDNITALYGLPVPIKKMGFCDQALCLSTGQRSFKFDAQKIAFMPVKTQAISWVSSTNLPEPITSRLYAQYIGQGLSFERVILDLHSGRIFGPLGVLLFDVAAVLFLFLFLFLSGFVLWYQQHQRKKDQAR
ncbi:MAG: putative iron-regulated membrane protein [Pseudohongiellaceae bacterium]|jgi:uncharacterized iron-regulated membrane protein